VNDQPERVWWANAPLPLAEAEPGMVAAAVAYGLAQLQTGDYPQLSAIYAESAQTGEPAGA
jgi:hypothetical protein